MLLGASGAAVAAASPAWANESFSFAATVKAQTTLAKLHNTVVIPPGKFHGTITSGSSNVGRLWGNLKLPPATSTMTIAGIGLATVKVAMVQTKPTVGTLNASTFEVKATSTFNIHVIYVKPVGLPVNVVGNQCITSTPVRLKFSGVVTPLSGGTVSGTYTIPPFANCSASTTVLNAAIAGGGNTFTAAMIPASG